MYQFRVAFHKRQHFIFKNRFEDSRSAKCNWISIHGIIFKNKLLKIKRIASIQSSLSLMIFRTNYIIWCLMTIWCTRTAMLWETIRVEIDRRMNRAIIVKVNYSICHFSLLVSSAALQALQFPLLPSETSDITSNIFHVFPTPHKRFTNYGIIVWMRSPHSFKCMRCVAFTE